jgi:hypothetical protein
VAAAAAGVHRAAGVLFVGVQSQVLLQLGRAACERFVLSRSRMSGCRNGSQDGLKATCPCTGDAACYRKQVKQEAYINHNEVPEL